MRNHCSKLVQLVHPLCSFDLCSSPQTKPSMIITTTPKPQTPQYRFPYLSYDISGSPNHSNVSSPCYMPETRFAYQAYADFSEIPVAVPARFGGEVAEENEEEVKEIIREILELFERLPSSLKDKVALEIMRNEMSKENGLNDESGRTKTASRGVGGPVEEKSLKMERFKVKTVTVGDVIKDDVKN